MYSGIADKKYEKGYTMNKLLRFVVALAATFAFLAAPQTVVAEHHE